MLNLTKTTFSKTIRLTWLQTAIKGKLRTFGRRSKEVETNGFLPTMSDDVQSPSTIQHITDVEPPNYFSKLSFQTQHRIATSASALLLTGSVVVAVFAYSLTQYQGRINAQIDGLTQAIQQLHGEVQSASTGDAISFIKAETTQNAISARLAELSRYASLRDQQLLSLPEATSSATWLDRAWALLTSGDVNLTDRLVRVMTLQDAFNVVLSRQPQYEAFAINTRLLQEDINALDKLHRTAVAQGATSSKMFGQFADNVAELQRAMASFLTNGGTPLDISILEQVRRAALKTLPIDGPDTAASTVQQMQDLLSNKMAGTIEVVSANSTSLNQDVAQDMATATTLKDYAIESAGQRINAPWSLKIIWGSSALLFLAGLGMLSMILSINAKESRLAAYAARKEQQETDEAVLTIMHELRPMTKGDLVSRITVTEHVTGSIADRINMSVDAIQEAIAGVKTASREVDFAIKEIFAQTEKAKDLTVAASNQAEASRAASEQGSQAVAIAVQSAQKQRSSMQEVAKRIKHLGEVAQSITRVIDLIEEITGKTDVLAINTSLKAANAGEDGAAFRVIAEELRKLTNDTRRSLQEITSAVQSMQGETQSAIATVESTTAEVVGSNVHWDGAMNSLKAIRSSAAQVDRLMDAVRQASTSQVSAASSALQVMDRLTSLAIRFRTDLTEESPVLIG